MSTVSSVSTSNAYGYSLALTSAGVAASSNAQAVKAQAAAIQSSLVSTLVSLGNNNSSSALTYNAAGLLSSFQPVSTNTTAISSAQSAQNAVLAADNAITQTLSSLASGSAAKQTSTDIYSLLGLTTAAGSDNFLGLTQGSLLNSTVTGGSKAQTSQSAVLAAQYAVTQTLNSLTASPASTLSSIGI